MQLAEIKKWGPWAQESGQGKVGVWKIPWHIYNEKYTVLRFRRKQKRKWCVMHQGLQEISAGTSLVTPFNTLYQFHRCLAKEKDPISI